MSDPVACLFRVKLQFLNESAAKERPVVSERHHVTSIAVFANDGDAAVSAAREYERRCGTKDCLRLVGGAALDKAIFGRAPEKSLDDMSVEELEARFRIMQERQTFLWWGGFAGGFGGGAFGGFKLAALAAAL